MNIDVRYKMFTGISFVLLYLITKIIFCFVIYVSREDDWKTYMR